MIFYKARHRETGNMWDTWGFHHGGTYHLYYLANSGDKGWDNISMATSPDGANWSERGPILHRRATSIWMGTGSTWKSPLFARDGRFLMNFSAAEGVGTRRQTIFFAESRDLVNWTRLGDEYEFMQDERWYEREGRWDCIFTVPKPQGGGLYGYLTATPKEGRGTFGFAQSADGVRWEALPPPASECPPNGEVGAVAFLAGRHYMMFGTGGSMIMLTFVADRPEGPFVKARKNFTLLSGHTYFARSFEAPDGTLVSHHCIARDGEVYAAPFTRAVVDGEGTLRLGWWAGNEKKKRAPLAVAPSGDARQPIAPLDPVFRAADGLILEGCLRLPGAGDLARRGLCIECTNGERIAIAVAADGTVEVGPIGADGCGFQPDKRSNREMAFGSPARFRLLLEHSLLQFYLDDILMEGYSLPSPATGRVGLMRGGDEDSISGLAAWSAGE